MTDIPPRTPPGKVDRRTDTRPPQTGMWLVLLVVVALIVAVVVFTFDRSASVLDEPDTTPAATTPDQGGVGAPEAAPDQTDTPTGTTTDTGTDDGAATVDPTAPAPGTAGETPPAEP